MSKPETARRVIELVNGQWGPSDYQRAEAGRELARRVERVLARHSKIQPLTLAPDFFTCDECGQEWPCSTVRALDGAE